MLSRRELLTVSGSLLLFAVVVFGVASTRPDRIYAMPSSLLPFSVIVAVAFLGAFAHSALYRESRLGLVPLGLFGGLLLCAPFLFVSGIYGFSTDTLYHLGKAREILLSGHLLTDSTYPFTHVYVAQLSRLLDIPLAETAMLLPPILFGVFVAGIALLAWSWDDIDTRLAILTPFAFIMSLGFDTGGYTYYKPYFAAVLFTGFALALFLRTLTTPETARSWQLLSLVALVAILFLHPIAFLVAFLVFVVYFGLTLEPVRSRARLPISRYVSGWTTLFFAIGVSSLLFGYWMVLQAEFLLGVTLKRALTLVTRPETFFASFYRSGAAATYPQTVITSQSSRLAYLARYYGLQYGGALLALLTTAAWGVWSVFGRMRNTSSDADRRRDGVVLAWLVGSGLVFVGNATANVLNVGITRPVPFLLVVFAIPVARLATYGQRARRASVAVLVVCAALGVFLLYPSPILYTTSPQATQQDISGMSWLFATKSDAKINDYQMDQHRFGAYVLGFQELADREDIYSFGATTPDGILHNRLRKFGRTGELSVQRPRYLPVSEFDHWYVSRYYPSPARARGLARLERTPPVEKVYTNGELTVYYVAPSNSTA